MNNLKCKFNIVSSAIYLPPFQVTATDLAAKTGVSAEWIIKATGVKTRYYAKEETLASMAAKAITKAMEKSHLKYEDIDLIIAAGGTPDQPIPHNSSLIHKELNLPKNITPFDVNGTCLSFVHALLIASSLINSKLYKNIIIVSSEKPSTGLNYKLAESSTLFGDGAVAFIISETQNNSGLIFSEFETYSEAAHLAETEAGGTRIHSKDIVDPSDERLLFKMDGQKIYKKASMHLPQFLEQTLNKNNITINDFKMVVPHQASIMALNLIQKKLNIPEEKFFINIHKYGNLVAASIPFCIHELLESKTLKTGDKALLLSTAAGLTIGAMGIVI